MERKVSFSLYAWAFFISLIIFAVGVFIGFTLDSSNLDRISSTLGDTSSRLSSLQLLILMEGNTSAFCPVFTSQLDDIDKQVEKTGYELSYLEDQKGVTDPELKKSYFVQEAESYLLSKKVKSLCGDKSVLLINFYSNTNCTRCKDEGTQILQARDSLESAGFHMKLFSFDGDLGSPVADAFKTEFNVTGYPSVVIDEKLYPGYSDQSQLQQLVKARG